MLQTPLISALKSSNQMWKIVGLNVGIAAEVQLALCDTELAYTATNSGAVLIFDRSFMKVNLYSIFFIITVLFPNYVGIGIKLFLRFIYLLL